MHVMYDLETLGVSSDAAIVQIGAVAIHNLGEEPGMVGPNNAHLGSIYRRGVRLDDPLIGELDGPTVKWWMEQDGAVRRHVMLDDHDQRLTLRNTLLDFEAWLESLPELSGLWADIEDHTWLRHAFERCGLKWRWRKVQRDYRTMREVGKVWCGEEEPPFKGSQHVALDDARHQAQHLMRVVNQISYYVGR